MVRLTYYVLKISIPQTGHLIVENTSKKHLLEKLESPKL